MSFFFFFFFSFFFFSPPASPSPLSHNTHAVAPCTVSAAASSKDTASGTSAADDAVITVSLAYEPPLSA